MCRILLQLKGMKIISGGQCGIDQIALIVAKKLDIPTGGTAPTGFLTSSGQNLSLRDDYGLEEYPKCKSVALNYILRSQKNVDDADGTIVFLLRHSVGSMKTIGYATTGKWEVNRKLDYSLPFQIENNCVIVDVNKFDSLKKTAYIKSFVRWVICSEIKTLNVAGNRDVPKSDLLTTFKTIKRFLEVFKCVN